MLANRFTVRPGVQHLRTAQAQAVQQLAVIFPGWLDGTVAAPSIH